MRDKLIELICEGTQKTEICTTATYMDCEPCRGDCGYCTILADHLIANGVTIQRWIPASERLPSDRTERVLVKIKDANSIIGHPDMDTDRYSFDLGYWVRWGECVTHWMPLPEPPKGE